MMKKISILTAFITIILTGCLKDDPNVDFGQLKPTIELINSGLGYFSSAALLFPSDTLTVPVVVNLASVDRLDKDITVTLAVDPDAVTAYNSQGGLQFDLMNPSSYSFPVTSVTIPAGKRIDTVYVSFYQHTFDPVVNYMLPISITDASGINLSSNFNTQYFHVFGNPIAGSYLWDFKRWDASDSTSVPLSSLSFFGEPTSFAPDDPTTIEVPSGYYIQPRYVLSFDNNNGVLSNFSVSLNTDDVQTMADNGVTVVNGPNILIADPIANVYEFQYTVLNTTPANRYIVDKYYGE